MDLKVLPSLKLTQTSIEDFRNWKSDKAAPATLIKHGEWVNRGSDYVSDQKGSRPFSGLKSVAHTFAWKCAAPQNLSMPKQHGKWLRMYPMASSAFHWQLSSREWVKVTASHSYSFPGEPGEVFSVLTARLCPAPGWKHVVGPSQSVLGTALATKPWRWSLSNACECSQLDL